MANPGQGQGQAPSSPSWSVPLHRAPPGVIFDQYQSPVPASGSGSMMPSGSYPYPPAPVSQQWQEGQGQGPGQYEDTNGGWYMPESTGGAGAGAGGNGGYPPGAGPGPSSSSYMGQRRDTMMSSGSQSVTHLDPPHNHGRSLSISGSGSLNTGTGTPDVGDAKVPAKKKRKKGSPAGETEKEKEKRTKTGRACDACRTKKIRCEILSAEDAMGREALCAHCKQYDLECTFFLPITETRFKKKKLAEQSAQAQTQAPSDSSRGITKSPRTDTVTRPQDIPTRLEGPTSLSFLLHTALPASTSEAYDLRNHNKWEISEDGNGLIRVNAPPSTSGYADADPDDPSRQHNRLNRPILSAHTISLLVNAYFEHLAPLFPVVSKADFAAKANPSPLLLYSICGLAATMRHFPREVFAGVRGVINGLLRSNDILSDARFEHVQALLILGQAGDLHAQPTAATASASLIRMGTAIRMAQDLGLHRESNLKANTAQDLVYVELRRRVWAACVIFDRWYGAALGTPLLVDLCDCDVLLPAPYEVVPDTDPSTWPVDESFMALGEHLKLCILVGRVLKTIYSPTGLKHATDEQLESLIMDFETWFRDLPDQLRYKGPESSHNAGLLHLGHCALQFLFWRVFMRITHTLPSHLKVHLTTEHWSRLVQWSRESIDWLHHNNVVLDSLFIYPYTATSAALIQYHTWVRRMDPAALDALKVAKEVASEWERIVQPDQMSIRRKTCETTSLLYEAALKTNLTESEDGPSARPSNVNPTAGVRMRETFGNSVFISDSTKPGGGIWVAQNRDEMLNAGLPQADQVLEADYKGANGSQPNSEPQAQVNEAGPVGPASNGLSGNNNVPSSRNSVESGSQDMLQNMQMSTTNVNPNINTDMGIPMQDPTQGALAQQVLPGQELFMDGGNGVGFDASLLEGLPLNQFNWNEWNTYFENLNSIPMTGQVENGNIALNSTASGSGSGSAIGNVNGPRGYGQL